MPNRCANTYCGHNSFTGNCACWWPSECEPEPLPVALTVFTTSGDWTVTVREDSIEYKPGGVLIAEGPKGTPEQDDIFTFFGVIGYRSRIVRN